MEHATVSTKGGPIFIVGAPRSGTTLLQYMLRSHPRISIPSGESHFLIPLYQMKEKLGDLRTLGGLRHALNFIYERNPSFLETDLHGLRFEVDEIARELREHDATTVEEIIDWIFSANARGEGKVRWGDKTPYYALHIDKLISMFPDAQIIHIIRDGRDCALSMLERKHDLCIYNTYDAAQTWWRYVSSAQRFGAQLGKQAYFELQYENLVADPKQVMAQTCAFLGEEYSDALVEFKKPKTPGRTPLLQRPIQSENKGKWQHRMSRWQLHTFEALCSETLRRNGFPLVTNSVKLPGLIRLSYRLHSRLSQAYKDKLIDRNRQRKPWN